MELFKLFGDILINDKASKVIDEISNKASELANGLASGVATAAKWTAGIAAAGAAAVGVVGAGLLKLSSDTASAADRIDKMSIRLGVSRQAFQEWDYILSQSGSDIDGLQIGMKTLTQRIDEANTKGSEGAKAFQELGIQIKEGMSQEEVFEEVVKALQGTEDQLKKTTIAQTLLGRAGQDLLPLLNTTAKDTDKLRENFKNLELQMSDNAVSAGVKFTDTMDNVKRSFTAIRNELGEKVMPIMQRFFDMIIKNMPTIKKIIEVAFSAMEISVNAFIKTFNFVSKIFEDNWKDWAIIALEYSNYVLKTWKSLIDGLNSFLKSNSDTFDEIKNIFSTTFKFVSDAAVEFWDWLKKIWDNNSTDIKELTKVLGEAFDNFAISIKELWKVLSSTEALAIYKRTFESISNFAETYISVTIDWIQLLIALMTGDFKKAGEEFQSIFKKAFSGAEKIIKPYFEDIKLIFSFLWEDYIQPPLEDALNKTIEFVKEVPTKIKEAGENIVIGLGDGISSKAGYAIDKMKDASESIFNSVTDFFDIQSPSKLMIGPGQYIIIGLGDGIESEKETLLDKTSKTLQTIIDATDATIEKLKNEKTSEKIMSALTPSQQEKADYEQGYADYYANLEKLAQEDLKRREDNKGKRIAQTKSEVLQYEEEYDNFYNDLAQKATNKGEEIAISISGFVEKYGGLIQALGDAVGGKFGDVVNGVMVASDVAVKALSGNWAGAATSLITNIDTIETGFNSLFDGIFKKGKSSAETMSDAWKEAFENAEGLLKTFGENVGNFFTNTLESFTGSIKQIKENVNNGLLPIFIETGLKLVANIDSMLKTTIDSFEQMSETVKIVLTSIEEFSALTFEKFEGNINEKFQNVAEYAQEMYNAVKPIVEQLTETAISEADKLGTAITSALKKRYEEEEAAAQNANDKELARLEKLVNDKQAQYNQDYLNKIASIDEEYAQEIALRQGRIQELDGITAEEKRIKEEAAAEEKKINLQKIIDTATTEEDRIKAKKELQQIERDEEKTKLQQELADIIQQIKDKKELAKKEFDENMATSQTQAEEELNLKKDNLLKERDAITEHYAKLKDSAALEAEALKIATENNQDELINLLAKYEPEWQNKGQSFGQKLVNGLNSTKTTIQETVDDILKKVSTAQEAQTKLEDILKISQIEGSGLNTIQTLTDTGLKSSNTGTIQRGQETIQQNITIISPDATDPVENARQIRNASIQLLTI